jgi:hypothetical protein
MFMSMLHTHVSMLHVHAASTCCTFRDLSKHAGMDRDTVPDIDMDTDKNIEMDMDMDTEMETLVKKIVLQSFKYNKSHASVQ